VLSKRPKNIWDISAGTIMCADQGISFFEMGKKIEKLDKTEYQPPLIWCREEHYSKIYSIL
jgi:myo-inositol-1(or 4)-monophosphatase